MFRNDFDGLKARLERLQAADQHKFNKSLLNPPPRWVASRSAGSARRRGTEEYLEAGALLGRTVSGGVLATWDEFQR
jgi:hypothetical protein